MVFELKAYKAAHLVTFYCEDIYRKTEHNTRSNNNGKSTGMTTQSFLAYYSQIIVGKCRCLKIDLLVFINPCMLVLKRKAKQE